MPRRKVATIQDKGRSRHRLQCFVDEGNDVDMQVVVTDDFGGTIFMSKDQFSKLIIIKLPKSYEKTIEGREAKKNSKSKKRS